MAESHLDLPPVHPDSPVQAVVLDWGGVMSNAGRAGQVGENLAHRLGIPVAEGERLVAASDHDLKRGLAGEDDFWRQIERHLGAPVPVDSRDIWIPAAQLAPHPEMVDAVGRLRAAGYLVGLLTNTHPAASRAVASIGGYDGFDAVVASNLSVTHSAKPEEVAYRESWPSSGSGPTRRCSSTIRTRHCRAGRPWACTH